MEQNREPRRITFKHFVAECDPEKSPLVGLKNHNTSRVLYCYLGTLNDILAICPKLFNIQRNTQPEGEDRDIFTEDIAEYGGKNYCNKKIVGIVKRYKNKISVCVQQMFDEHNTGNFKYSPSLVQFSAEDDLEKLRAFAQEMRREHAAVVKNKMEAVAQPDGEAKSVVIEMEQSSVQA